MYKQEQIDFSKVKTNLESENILLKISQKYIKKPNNEFHKTQVWSCENHSVR